MRKDGPLQMLVTNLDYDEHKGRIAIGRVTSGKITRAEAVVVGRPGTTFSYHGHDVRATLHSLVMSADA